jgi:transposase
MSAKKASGKTVRHRVSRGGDRQANSATHRLAVRRMGWDPATHAYVRGRTAERPSMPENHHTVLA